MGRKLSKGGVEVRDSSIRVSFTHLGKLHRETVKRNGIVLPPSPANVKFAVKLADDVRTRIKAGNFTYREWFPDSPHAEPAAEDQTFGKLADQWLKSKGQLEDATVDQYGTAVRIWKRLLGEHAPIASLTHQTLAEKIGAHPWPSAKSANNYLVALRGIMGFVYHGPRAAENPMVGIRNLTVVKKKPDPLTAAERDRILADLRERYDRRVWAYFAFAFATGMRPEEMIALRWGDVDNEAGTVRVQRVRTFRGTERDGSKTHSERDVDLMPTAVEALAAMKPYTHLKRDDIFENPVTGEPWHDERSQRDHYWKPCLKRLGIRDRRAYATRHTYATVALMGGVNPAYVSAQMGHVSTKMFFETYSRWIAGADNGAQKAAMAALHISRESPQISTEIPKPLNFQEKSGRRDWTRTKSRGDGG